MGRNLGAVSVIYDKGCKMLATEATITEERFLQVLDKKIGITRASVIGAEVWDSEKTQCMPQVYCRPASRVLGRMRVKGLVRFYTAKDYGGWRITEKGRNVARLLRLRVNPRKGCISGDGDY